MNEEEFERERIEKEELEREKLQKEILENERLEKERLENEALERERLEKERLEKEALEKVRLEKERLETLKMENKLYPNNSLFLIPSWGDLLGYPTLGTYVHHPVSKIVSDTVIFLSGYDYSIETTKGTLHYLFGLGYYFLKFELESGKYVTDNRTLTGLALSDFVYDHMATSANITLEEDRDVIIAEKVIKIPLNLSSKSENHLTFIKGALMRNIFMPNKDIFLEMMETIRKDDSYQIVNKGHKILSSHWDLYNQLLVSDKMKAYPDSPSLNQTAGLAEINFKADGLLHDTISSINLSIIEDSIKTLKKIYTELEFDPMYLFSIIEKASQMLNTGTAPVSSIQRDSTPNKTAKNSIFASAEERAFEFISWPIQFKRNAKKEVKILTKTSELPSSQNLNSIQLSDGKTPEIKELKHETFELETLKSEKVEFKPLPQPPITDINAILIYLKTVIEENYEMKSIGQAFEIARESIRRLGVSSTTLHQKKVWEISKYANIYVKKEPGHGLPIKEKSDVIRIIDKWIFEIEETARLERERLARVRVEKERLERLELERIQREKQEKERQEAERLERTRIEKERAAQEQVKKEQLEKIESEKQEELRIERERIEKEREEQEAIEREKQELERLKQERKQKEKAAKQEAKNRKKLDKQKKKIEKKKLKEQEKLNNL
ncbi:MAG: hypothetical protein ACTSQK_12270 [Candidatus Heimdallarchaeota archaeon]